MGNAGYLFVNFIRAVIVTGFIGLVIAGVSLIVTYIFDLKNIREKGSHLSTGVGNALLTLHSFFQPGVKPSTEQVVWVKKRRTPYEKGVLGLSELGYDKILIKGYKRIAGSRRFFKKKL